MGYYTYYELDYEGKGAPSRDTRVVDALCKANSDYFDRTYWVSKGYSDTDIVDNFFNEELKWYDHDRDMREVSRLCPNILFTLWGRGEDWGDMWKAYYLNGKMQFAPGEMVYPEFDERELT